MKKKNKQPTFYCDVDGGIMVTCALRYALGRMTYVPGVVQDWIRTYWTDLDSNTKCVVVIDVFEYLYDEFKTSKPDDPQPFGGYDLKEWEKFAIDRYWLLDYNERKGVDPNFQTNQNNKKWWAEIIIPKLYESTRYKRLQALEELSKLDQELGLT